jgi:hypothetical protein
MKQRGDVKVATVGGMQFLSPSWWVQHGPQLKCEEETCESLLPLFVRWNPATTLEALADETARWKWDNLKCPQGHPILKPDYDIYAV